MRILARSRTALAASVLAIAAIATTASAQAAAPAGPSGDTSVVDAVGKLTRSTPWALTERIPLRFDAFHPQGFARVGDRLFMSSVEVTEAPVRYPQPVDGYDRSPGKGRGHVFVLDLHGNLLRDIVVGEGDMYHPGGIDSDGTSLWVPVAEYRPYSDAVVYRIDLKTLQVHEAFRADDHIGGVVADPTTKRVHGVTWGSREFYTWNTRGKQLDHTVNTGFFIDYQDCAYAKRRTMLCTGVAGYPTDSGRDFELGGIATIDLTTLATEHEVPVSVRSSANHVATRNPVHLEADGSTLRLWASPDDGNPVTGSEILVYEATVGS